MIPITIQCGCGQQYTFEVEPIAGQMPSPVACPICGADGTAAANEALAESVAAQPAIAAPGNVPSLSVSSTSNARRHRGAPLPGQPDRTQAMYEARAKISWGDRPKEVILYLMGQGFSPQEASGIV